MVARTGTVAFEGIRVVDVDVQVQMSNGLPSFTIVGLPDKAVGESRERVRAALHGMGLALPNKRITVNLSPADLTKEGSHYDLPVALCLLAAMEVISVDQLDGFVVLGELGLDGKISPVGGIIAAAVHALKQRRGLVCPATQGPQAVWAGVQPVCAPPDLLSLINHFKGNSPLPEPRAPLAQSGSTFAPALDLSEIKGQETAKRALEVAAAGRHNLMFCGPPGAGKSMLAARIPDLLPPMSPSEILEVSQIHSLSGQNAEDGLITSRPFREPHHTASTAAIIGGGQKARPGEVSLAHRGVLFLDELPEFNRATLESLRQPLETASVTIARAHAHCTYPASFQLVAAMNPCRCGHLADQSRACSKAPLCAESYQSRLSGPLIDRIDIHADVPALSPADMALPPAAETTSEVAERIRIAWEIQSRRYQNLAPDSNAEVTGKLLDTVCQTEPAGKQLLYQATERFALSARGYARVLRVGRTLADLDASESVKRIHIAEALAYRQLSHRRAVSRSQIAAE